MTIRNILLTTTATSLMLGTIGFALMASTDSARADLAANSQELSQADAPKEFEDREYGAPEYGGPGRGRRQHEARLAATADQLGVSEAALRSALGLPEEPIEPDFAGAAAQLGTTETELRNDLREAHQRGSGVRGVPEAFAAVADQYGVTTEELLMALNLPTERPSRPDLTAAAEQLGVSEDELREALKDNFRHYGEGPSSTLDEQR